MLFYCNGSCLLCKVDLAICESSINGKLKLKKKKKKRIGLELTDIENKLMAKGERGGAGKID